MRRLLHLSDVHFGPLHSPRAATAIAALVAERRPDLVVLSGDLTQRAKPPQFRAARRFVDALPAPVLVVPGNHDVPLFRFWERCLSPFGAYRRHFASDLEPVFRDDELLVVGVNTAFNWTFKDGRIRRARLRRLAAELAAAPPGLCRIVVAHHQLVPAPGARARSVMRRAPAIAAALAAGGVELVLSGHLHQAFVAASDGPFPAAAPPFAIVHAGTTTSHRGRGPEHAANTGWWIEIRPDAFDLTRLVRAGDDRGFAEGERHRLPRRLPGGG